MELIFSCVQPFVLKIILLFAIFTLSDCYDPLDPNGNITITFDILEYRPNGYLGKVTIQNYYQYRHVDKPGWNLGWTWTRNEVILSMSGAFATAQGDCSSVKSQIPHCCKPNPVIADLMPDAPPANRSEDCCHGGLLSAWAIDPFKSFSSFEMTIGNLEQNTSGYAPANLTLLAPGPGYTCGAVLETEPSKSSDWGGKRETQVSRTWKSTCTYSSFLANKHICCVSLSTFYNTMITECPKCSCGCKEANQNTVQCISKGNPTSQSDADNLDIVQCTDHMCPVRVHWHIKNNYMDHWRVRVTISNYNYERNYSDWNLVVQHPGFSQKTTTYSFNSTVLATVGFQDEVALFWGLPYYNDELLQANDDEVGSVMTEILLEKDSNEFTLTNGWALPRRIYFGGEECSMPLPDTFPMLPNGSSSTKPPHYLILLIFLIFKALVTWPQ